MHLFEKTIDSEVKYEGKILTVCSDKAELENGAIVSRDVIRHSGGVGVVPVTDEGDVLFVRQFRYPFQKVLMEIPAGKLNAGEDHAEAGKNPAHLRMPAEAEQQPAANHVVQPV